MRILAASRALAAAALIGAAAPAAAFNCYIIVDRSNVVIYQDLTSPIDLSDEGAAARDALRGRGQQLIATDADRCPAIDRGNISGKSRPATVDEIVAGMRSAVPNGAAASAPRAAAGAGGISLPRVPVATGRPVSPAAPLSGMGLGLRY
jgi:hypothetical protein